MRRRISTPDRTSSKPTIDIDTLAIIEGQPPRRALSLVHEWAIMHKEELLEDWRLCRGNAAPAKIAPLV